MSMIEVLTLPLDELIARFSKLPPVAESILTTKFSVPSVILSSMVATLKSALLAPAGIFTMYTPVKSEPSAAVPL
ncbi:hypothetical protein D3C86_1654380 [compost metagenome]